MTGTTEPMSAAGSGERLVVLVDDVRVFRDGRATHVAQTASQALAVLAQLAEERIKELWLDHDLFEETSQPVVDHLVALAEAGTPANVELILVHSSQVVEGLAITSQLLSAGYRVRRSYASGIWARNPNSILRPRNPA